jgi:hydroxymethylbilane synthase
VDATLLALAGLKRLGMHELVRSSQVVGWDEMLPAVAQGAIGIQCRTNDHKALAYLAGLNHADTKAAVDCERAFLGTLDGNCRTPIAGQAKIVHGNLLFKGILSKPDGSDMLHVEMTGAVEDAVALGQAAGEDIRRQAGAKFSEYQEAFVQAKDAASSGTWADLKS